MTIHENIKSQIKDALRAKDTLRLDVLRGLNALSTNEILATNFNGEFLPDDKMLAIIKRCAKQRKDSIEQFQKGGRTDLAEKEKSELNILESFLPSLMSKEQVHLIARERIAALKIEGNFDPKAGGKIVGSLMKELAGKADGTVVKAVVDELIQAEK